MIQEVVDIDHHRPVEPGQPCDRLLVSVLFNRTLPLIRYEMTDPVRLAAKAVPMRLPRSTYPWTPFPPARPSRRR